MGSSFYFSLTYMAWKAKLVDIRQNNGTADVQVEYYNGETSYIRSYNLHPESFPTQESFQEFIENEAKKFNDFDIVGNNLTDLVGKDIF